VPRLSSGNQPETSLTAGTKTPAPRRPERNLVTAACQKTVALPKRRVAQAMPRMLEAITLLLPCLSARRPQGIWPMV
jgi:hypothetical protein